MRHFASRCLSAVTCLALIAMFASCTPSRSAVGDTQGNPAVAAANNNPVAHDSADRTDVSIGIVGSGDVPSDRRLLDAFDKAQLNASYLSMSGSDPIRAAQQGVDDFTTQFVNVIIINRLDVTAATKSGWDAALMQARSAGVPVILTDPQRLPGDGRLYAAIFRIRNAVGVGSTPIDTATLAVVNDTPHAKTVSVSMKAAAR